MTLWAGTFEELLFKDLFAKAVFGEKPFVRRLSDLTTLFSNSLVEKKLERVGGKSVCRCDRTKGKSKSAETFACFPSPKKKISGKRQQPKSKKITDSEGKFKKKKTQRTIARLISGFSFLLFRKVKLLYFDFGATGFLNPTNGPGLGSGGITRRT